MLVKDQEILIYGTLSREVKIERSIRQGCLTYICFIYRAFIAKKLSFLFRSPSPSKAVFNAYADVLSPFVNDLEIVKTIKLNFGMISRARWNVSKLKAAEIGFGSTPLPTV